MTGVARALIGVSAVGGIGLISLTDGASQTAAVRPPRSDVRQPAMPLDSRTVAAFVASHKGPILSVSHSGDCPYALKRSTFIVPFDHDHVDGSMQAAADYQFIDTLRRSRVFVQVQRNQTPVLVVCCGGVRSKAAARVMAAHGFHVRTLDGGISDPDFPKDLIVAVQ